MQQLTFQQSIESSYELIEKLDKNSVTPAEAQAKIAEYLQDVATARGFFVSLLTGDWSFDTNIPDVVIDTIGKNPEHANNLLAKNLVMSSATAVTHERSPDPDLASGSKRVIDRSSHIIVALNKTDMNKEIVDMLTAVEDRLKNVVTSENKYGAFLERWAYDSEQMQAASKSLKRVIEKIGPSTTEQKQ